MRLLAITACVVSIETSPNPFTDMPLTIFTAETEYLHIIFIRTHREIQLFHIRYN